LRHREINGVRYKVYGLREKISHGDTDEHRQKSKKYIGDDLLFSAGWRRNLVISPPGAESTE